LDAPLVVCLIGAGPRGLSLVERLCANARAAGTGIEVHLVDPYPPGAGRVWRSNQSRHLLMNTIADQISVFTDASVEMDGPLELGPTLYEWSKVELPADSPDTYDDETRAEARDLGRNTYPTRALHGHYLQWAFRQVVSRASERTSVLVHRATAVAVEDDPTGSPRQRVLLADGTRLDELDAVVLAQGHLPVRPTDGERRLAGFAAGHRLTYLPPANPAELDLTGIGPGEPVLLRGLGLSFFDLMALLTVGRGGRFEQGRGRVVYRPSGLEPQLLAGSRRGIPYQARGENEKGQHGQHEPLLLTPARIAALREAATGGGVDFRADVWPLVAGEVETVYYCTLLGSDAGAFRAAFLALPPGADTTAVLDRFGVLATQRWDWHRIARPYDGQSFDGPADFDGWMLAHLRRDVAEARAGNVSGPLKAALDVLRDIRNELRMIVDHAGLHGQSHREDLDGWYTPLNAHLSIGPPVSRVEQMVALLEAGTVRVVGPGMTVEMDPAAGRFVAESPLVPGSRVTAGTLIEARIPEITVTRTADPLLRGMFEAGQCRVHRIPNRGPGWHDSEGLAVTERPFRVVDAQGRPHPRRFAFGVPTESVHWATAAGIRPNVNSVTLADADGIARAVLRCARRAVRGTEVPA
jgi:uncharacterized NAD(P)/FAD-binding protein YdhS